MNNLKDEVVLLPNNLLQEIENPRAINEDHDPLQTNLNLKVGFMRFQDPRDANTVFKKFTMQINPHANKAVSNANLSLHALGKILLTYRYHPFSPHVLA
jgi:hypothetical protein